MSSLRQRLADRSWEQDWPAAPAEVALPEGDWVAALALTPWEQGEAKHKALAERQFHQVVAVLRHQPSEAIPQAILHRHLDALDAWNASATWQATWPPTLEGLGRSIAASHEKHAQKPEVMMGLALLLHAYPDRAWAALQAMPAWARKDLPSVWFEPARAEPEVVVPTETPSEPVRAESPIGPVASPSEPKPVEATPVETAVVHERAPSAETLWLTGVMDQLAQSQQAQPVVRQRLTQELRQRRQQGAVDWFEQDFFPALAAQPTAHLRAFLSINPDVQFTVQNPVEWVRGANFWNPLREAGENQSLLMGKVLPRLVQTTGWTDAQRSIMLRSLIHTAKHDPAVFEQRMGLWQAWGGQLDMRLDMKASRQEATAESVSHSFGGAARAPTVLEWLQQQPVALWQTWAASRMEPASPYAVPAPIAAPPPRRPRGP